MLKELRCAEDPKSEGHEQTSRYDRVMSLCPQKRQAFAKTMFMLEKVHNEEVLLVTLRTPRLSHVTSPRGFSAAPMHARMRSSRLGGVLARHPKALRVPRMWVLAGLPMFLAEPMVARPR